MSELLAGLIFLGSLVATVLLAAWSRGGFQ